MRGQTSTILACDVGGTLIKLGLVNAGRLLAREILPAEAHEGLASALKRVELGARGLCQRGSVQLEDIQGFGLAFPGIIEPGTGRILSTPAGKFDDAKTLDVPGQVWQLLGLPAQVCNDANAALAGEWRYGAARGFRSVVMMTLGTGIGTSAIIDGVPLRGQHGQAGCLGGHFMADANGRLCRCGNHGCAEAEASTWSLPERARRHDAFPASRLAQEKILDFAAVFRAAAQGDAVAEELRGEAIRLWAGALVSLIHAYDPECAIMGGGIMASGAFILPRLRRYVARHAWTPWGRVTIKLAALGDDAGLAGAASLFEGPS